MVFKFWLGMLNVGKPSRIGPDGQYDAAITLCWRRRHYAPVGELQWRHIWRFAFDLLPQRRYRPLSEKPRQVSGTDRLKATLLGQPISASAETQHSSGIDSSRWTGRERAFAGFGEWRHQLKSIRSTRRSKVFVFLAGAKERANPRHVLYVTPGVPGLGGGVSANDVPDEWKQPSADGTTTVPRQFEVVFTHGRASVDERLGEWLVKTGHAQRTPLVRASGNALLGGLASLISGRVR